MSYKELEIDMILCFSIFVNIYPRNSIQIYSLFNFAFKLLFQPYYVVIHC
jgi:hypothetical protein